jgi:solute carrier family 25 carnitine/acylcarnitine transporter 20/29
MGAAGVGGITYWLAIFPVDVIKSSMQSDTIIKAERKYTDMATTARVSGQRPPAAGALLPAPTRPRPRPGSRAHRPPPCPPPAPPAQLLWQEGGVKRFYRGFTPCLIRAAPANGAMLLTVDRINAWLNAKK